jgi:undecaprenyl diphosphate synthase
MSDIRQNAKIPRHVGIIMDGNRRWAKAQGLPGMMGHIKGYEKIQQVGDWFFSLGVEVVSLYAFSTENWSRKAEEVHHIMGLLEKGLTKDFGEFERRGYKLVISGRVCDLPGKLSQICYNAIDKTALNTKGVLNICMNYGGRGEVLDAVKKIIKSGVLAEDISEETIRQNLYLPELPEPDIIVRTSGEQRLSGFLMWESVYSELLFMYKFWPEFDQEDAKMIVQEYGKRQRRFGGDTL